MMDAVTRDGPAVPIPIEFKLSGPMADIIRKNFGKSGSPGKAWQGWKA
jgi:hypothetical protein